jgi:hypothetical protein
MRLRCKLLLAGLAVSLLMSFAVGSASANRISVTNKQIRATWSNLRFADNGGTGRMTCQVTLEGSFHSATLRKIRGALMGYITSAIVHSTSCTGGSTTILNESLPWHVTYDSFTGVLPNITGIIILLHSLAFAVELGFGGPCLYAADATHRARGRVNIGAGGGGNTIDADNTIRLLRTSGTFLCPPETSFSGSGQVTLQGNTSRISVTLI